MATQTSSRSFLYPDTDAAEAAARGLREAGFSHIIISEAAVSATAPPTIREFWAEFVAALRRFARRGVRNRLAAKALHASSFAASLRDLGIAPERAAEFSRSLCAGAALVTVYSADAADAAYAVMQAFAPALEPQRSSHGRTRVRKVVTTEMRQFEVAVHREELLIERTYAADGGPVEEVRVPLTREEVRIDKRIVISASEDDSRAGGAGA